MSAIHHSLTTTDDAAMSTLRARLAAHPIVMSRASFDELVERVPPPEGVVYSEARVGGVPGVWCAPPSPREGTAMLYLHGGVHLFGSARAVRLFVGHLAARAGVPAFVADYRLAPEHPFPAAHDDARDAFRGLAAQLGARNVAVVGDSAGGGMALSLLRTEERAACGVLLSPWTDLALTGESLTARAAEDPLLTRSALEAGVRQYLGVHDPRDPRVSPLYGEAAGTSPIQVHVGTAEILLDDARRLEKSDGVELHVWQGMPHVFPRSIALFEAARASHEMIATFLRAHLRGLGEAERNAQRSSGRMF
jgi:acetyl esterase/lipase